MTLATDHADIFAADAIRDAHCILLETIDAKLAQHEDDIKNKGKLREIKATALEAAKTLKQQAIREQWTADKFELQAMREASAMELELVRAERPVGPSIYASHRDGGSVQHIAAALMVKAGFSAAAEKSYGEHVMEQSRRLHGQSLPDLCRAALQIDGRECPPTRDAMIRAALSTGSMPVALGDSANKVLVASYRQAPASWRSFAAIKPASNFKVQTGVRPTFGGDLEEVGNTGSIVHGVFAEEVFSWQIATFAKMFSIGRQDTVTHRRLSDSR